MNTGQSVWDNPANVETLRTMWREGASAAEIARAIGGDVSRSGVLGKVHRLKLPERAGDVRRKGHGQRAPAAAKVKREQPRVPPAGRAGEIAQARGEAASGVAPEPIKTIVDDGPVISLLQLSERTCKWPRGDPRLPGFGFCGALPIEGKPYCQRHSDRALRR